MAPGLAEIQANLRSLEQRIGEACRRAGRARSEVTIVAVTKTVSPDAVVEAYRQGLRHFGENRLQEAAMKLPLLAPATGGAIWHMVGHLQSNKARAALELFDSIDSVDSLKLAELLDRSAHKRTPILVEVNVAAEPSKTGFAIEELGGAVEEIRSLPNLDLRGLMTVAPLVSDLELVRPVFRRLRELREALGLDDLSMGMSDDFEVAIEEGATMVRIGRAIFGERRA